MIFDIDNFTINQWLIQFETQEGPLDIYYFNYYTTEGNQTDEWNV